MIPKTLHLSLIQIELKKIQLLTKMNFKYPSYSPWFGFRKKNNRFATPLRVRYWK